jgi:hypothetical protein
MTSTHETPSSNLTETANCPHCGAVMKYEPGATSIECHYCGQAIPVPNVEPVLREMLTAMEVAPTTPEPSPHRGSSAGCIVAIVGFVVFMVLVTVVLPIVLTNQALNSGSEMPSDLIATVAARAPTPEPTRRPPTAAPTPAFAEVLLQFGSQGMGAGQFTSAHLSGLDGAGHIYVGEYTGGRIQVFDATGKFINQFFVGDPNTILLGLAVDRKGGVYVADGAEITRYDGNTGKSLGKLKYSGGPGFGELALAPDGSLYAMWYQRREGLFTSVEGAREDLVHFDSSGKVLKVVQGVISSMTDSVELDNALAVDGRGNVYVDPRFEDQIFKFDAKGRFITRLGNSGGALAVDGRGRLFVADSSAIAVLKPDGSRLDQIEVSSAANGLIFDDAGALWITADDQVLKYQVKQQ